MNRTSRFLAASAGFLVLSGASISPARADARPDGGCLFATDQDSKVIGSYLAKWSEARKLGAPVDWSASFDRAQADVDVGLGAGHLHLRWHLAGNCAIEGLQTGASGKLRDALTDRDLESLTSGFPVAVQGQSAPASAPATADTAASAAARVRTVITSASVGIVLLGLQAGLSALTGRRRPRRAS